MTELRSRATSDSTAGTHELRGPAGDDGTRGTWSFLAADRESTARSNPTLTTTETDMTRSDPSRDGNLAVMADPSQWAWHPFLELIRPSNTGLPQFGFLFDAMGFTGWTGFSATVFLGDIANFPTTPEGL